MFIANIVPGQGFHKFKIYSKKGGLTEEGTPIISEYTETENSFWGILAEASQKDIAEWKQNQHPITHTIVQHGAEVKAKSTDYIVLENGRKFYIQGTVNAASFNVAMIYYVEERFDIK